jgi:hypothetical protein
MYMVIQLGHHRKMVALTISLPLVAYQTFHRQNGGAAPAGVKRYTEMTTTKVCTLKSKATCSGWFRTTAFLRSKV